MSEGVRITVSAGLPMPLTTMQKNQIVAAGYGMGTERLKKLSDRIKARLSAAEDDEQAAFEVWLAKACPSGDASSVQRQWLASDEYLDWCEDHKQEPKQIKSMVPFDCHCRECKDRSAVRKRHPFAQDSDIPGILAMEAKHPPPFLCSQCGQTTNDCTCPVSGVKPALVNAMVVRGGHDDAGWRR